MRTLILSLLLGMLLPACGGDSVDDHLEALAALSVSLEHRENPSPLRFRQMFPHVTAEELAEYQNGVRQHIEAWPAGRALLSMGDGAVPPLAARLEDPELGVVAASVLAEIGTDAAMRALLAAWRSLREDRTRYSMNTAHSSGDAKTWTAHQRREGTASVLCGEVVASLSWSGVPVSSEVAVDTLEALRAARELQDAGEPLEYTEEDERTVRRWYAGPVETAREGLHILANSAAPDAPRVFEAALASGVRPMVLEAMTEAFWLGPDAEKVVPDFAAFLDDPDLRIHAARSLRLLLDRDAIREDPSDAEIEALVPELRRVLRERGPEAR